MTSPAAPTVILIPSYEPDDRLVRLVDSLGSSTSVPIVVVDDGSGPQFAAFFAAVARAGATVLTHQVNRGKGAALRTGFVHVVQAFPGADVVCADSDGQHRVDDILRVADEVRSGSADLVLGGRRFTGTVPLRSRVGNTMTRHAFALATGRQVHDTQTGLRGHAAATLPWLLGIGGDLFDYELRVLLAAAREGLRLREIEIDTIYLEGNASSHFRPVRDSLAVWGQLLAFTASSLTGFAVDVVLLALLHSLTGSLLAAVVGARVISAAVNFTLNARFVFPRRGRSAWLGALRRYAALAVVVLVANALLMEALVIVTGSLAVAKVATEVVLFLASYLVQRTAVFVSRGRSPAGAHTVPSESRVSQATPLKSR